MLTDECALPRPILVDSILPYLDLHSLVRFTGVSKHCKDAVFRDMAGAHWSKVNLSGNQVLTDDQLHAFLENIDARENTKALSLVGCKGVNGVGLDPLRGSRVLEDIDLRVLGSLPLAGEQGELCGPSGLDEDAVSDILLGIPSLLVTDTVLRRVVIRPLQWRSHAMSLFRCTNYGQGLRPLFVHLDAGKPLEGLSSGHCYLCSVPVNKPYDVLCSKCDKEYCRACAIPFNCMDCDSHFCQWCSAAEECARCNKRSCSTCANHEYESCGGCNKMFCQDCKDQELEGCVVCNGCYCSEVCHKRAHR